MCLAACTQASTLVNFSCACSDDVCVFVSVGGEVVEGSKSAVIQALLSLLNDDVNL